LACGSGSHRNEAGCVTIRKLRSPKNEDIPAMYLMHSP
jgi:hypothetical protein